MSNADDLRAMCLQIGAELHATPARGFDTLRKRADLVAQWDDAYEDYLLELAAEMTPTPTDC